MKTVVEFEKKEPTCNFFFFLTRKTLELLNADLINWKGEVLKRKERRTEGSLLRLC